jgi:hypothetical protein
MELQEAKNKLAAQGINVGWKKHDYKIRVLATYPDREVMGRVDHRTETIMEAINKTILHLANEKNE